MLLRAFWGPEFHASHKDPLVAFRAELFVQNSHSLHFQQLHGAILLLNSLELSF